MIIEWNEICPHLPIGSKIMLAASFKEGNFMAHSAVWGYPPIQKQNKNSKKFMEEKLSENGQNLGRVHFHD